MSNASSPSETPSCTPSDGASCWICLEEGPDDDSGAPLVRDCSCRGHSGFAHVPCLIQYAESKSRDFVERGLYIRSDLFGEMFFNRCPNCKQSFQGDVRRDMTKAQLSFIEREFKDVHAWHLRALIDRIHSLAGELESNRVEAEGIIAKMLLMVEENVENCHSSFENVAMTLGTVYQSIGLFYLSLRNEFEKAKYYFQKSINSLIASGGQDAKRLVKLSEQRLALVCRDEAKRSRSGDSLSKETAIDVRILGAEYNNCIRLHGEADLDTIRMGSYFARELFLAFHTVEALRLLNKLVDTSRRVHGSSHEVTKVAILLCEEMRVRYVSFGQHLYQALRYDNATKSCIIQGPVSPNATLLGAPRNIDAEKTFSVPGADITFASGTSVMLHGLKKAAHLNGEIGDVREYCKATDRYVVHLESKGQKTVKAKQENLRIVFDLPDPKNLD